LRMEKISKEQFIDAIISGNKEALIQGIEEGMDMSIASDEQADGRRPPIEFASFVDNYDILYVLWQHKALATTGYIEAIFEKFKNGLLPEALYAHDKLEKEKRLNKVKLDLTTNFSAAKLQLKKVKLAVDENGSEIIVTFKPFKYENEVFERTIEFLTNDIVVIAPNSEWVFNTEEMDSSFYFDSVHNPVDLKRIKFGDKVGKKMDVELELFFDFEFEGTPLKNETIILKSRI
jgi:hypothetical protein